MHAYQIVDQLAVGPRAIVYRGRHITLAVPVAIKQLDPSLNPRAKERLFAAVERWAQVEHGNLLAVRDVDRSQGWIVSNLMTGSFADSVKREALPAQRVREMLVQCLEALDFLHTRHNCLHANLKPSNLLYDSQKQVKLSDGYMVAMTTSIELPVPPAESRKYLAPEMLGEGKEAIGPAADLYSLGFVILELLLGPGFGALFRGVGSDPHDTDHAWVRWHLTPSEAAPRAGCVPGIPHPMAMVIDRLLYKDLRQRYGSAREALIDLERAASPPPVPQPPRPEPPTPPEPPQSAPKVIGAILPRPAQPVLLRITSGSRAGEMVGLDSTEIHVGDGDDCDVKLSLEQYPGVAGRRTRIRCEASGWTVSTVGSSPWMVNHQVADGTVPIRSGDVVRMSLAGPDFQFILQNPGERSLIDLASAFLEPDRPATAPVAPAPPLPPSPGASPIIGQAAPISLPAPVLAVPGHEVAYAAPSAPGAGPLAPPQRPACAPLPPLPTGRAGRQAPLAAAPVEPAAAPGPEAVRPKSQFYDKIRRANWQGLLDYRRWSKRTQNWVVGIVSVIVAAIVVYVVPVGGSHAPSKSSGKDPGAAAPAAGGAVPAAGPSRSDAAKTVPKP